MQFKKSTSLQHHRPGEHPAEVGSVPGQRNPRAG